MCMCVGVGVGGWGAKSLLFCTGPVEWPPTGLGALASAPPGVWRTEVHLGVERF